MKKLTWLIIAGLVSAIPLISAEQQPAHTSQEDVQAERASARLPGRDDDQQDERPNILIIYLDDLDQTTLGYMGDPTVQTPNIDGLAAQGVVFDNAFSVSPICQTSRANLMTGRYAARTGIYMSEFSELTDAQIQMVYPRLMHDAGYYTGYVGKWHLGDSTLPEGVLDDDKRLPGQGRYWPEEDSTDERIHLTDKLGEQIVEMIRRAPQNRPFVLQVGFKAPHVQDGLYPVEPYPASPSTAGLYELDTIPAPPLSDQEFFESQPGFIQESLGRTRWEYRLGPPESLNFQRSIRQYYRLVTGVDQQVGRMIEALRETNRLDHTIIVFSSDHGMFLGERGLAGKWLMHDTSIRVPLIIVDPGLPESEKGSHRDEIALMIDFLPTLLDWAGVDELQSGVQGRSLVPIVNGESPEDWRTEFFLEHHSFPDLIPSSEGVRTEKYKYIRYINSEPLYEELYNLEDDPVEATNLAYDSAYQALLVDMRIKWEKWRNDVR